MTQGNGFPSSQPLGQPARLHGRAINFTSWQFVRTGSFQWVRANVQDVPGTDPFTDAIWGSDSGSTACFQQFNEAVGVRLRGCAAVKQPLPDFPGVINTLIEEDGRYRCWYSCEAPRRDPGTGKVRPMSEVGLRYAESTDGVHWDFPLGPDRVVYRGDQGSPERGYSRGTVFIDPTSSDARYKLFFQGMMTAEEHARFLEQFPGEADPSAVHGDPDAPRRITGQFGAESPDGLSWTAIQKPFSVHFCDTHNTCYYDVDRRRYVAYVRVWSAPPQHPDWAAKLRHGWAAGRRSIGRSVSEDFRHFSSPEVVISPGADMPPDELWYANCKTTLPGCAGQHVMFPWRWGLSDDGGDCWLFSTHDGWSWQHVPGGPAVCRDAEGTPCGSYVHVQPNLVALPNGDWALPYRGYPIPHKYPGRTLDTRTGLYPGVPEETGLAVWPKGRLVGLEAPREGRFSTLSFIPPGNRITLNAVAPPAGELRVAVHRLDGEIVPGRAIEDCDPIVGDSASHRLSWQGGTGLGANEGEPVFLEFRLNQAKLYAVQFED